MRWDAVVPFSPHPLPFGAAAFSGDILVVIYPSRKALGMQIREDFELLVSLSWGWTR
jgi:hypothetical protein